MLMLHHTWVACFGPYRHISKVILRTGHITTANESARLLVSRYVCYVQAESKQLLLTCLHIHYQIVEFLERKSNEGVVHLRRTDLMKDTKIPPLPAGLTCAAALPTQAWRLVPEPYSKVWLPEEFEEMYQSCVEPDTVFNMAKFQKKCTAAMKRAKKEGLLESNSGGTRPSGSRRKIYTSTKHWTVISRTKTPLQHPFTPPEPYTCKFESSV